MSQGDLGWIDLTVEDAETVRDFYVDVVGWQPESVDMGGYSDFSMKVPGGEAVAGVCHARGVNADLPVQWLPYWTVPDLEASLARVRERGGEIVAEPRGETHRFAVIRDPAGAACALLQSG